MMMQFTNRFHLFRSLERLSVVDNEKQMVLFLGEQTTQHVQGDLLHDDRPIPVTSPKKFAVIRTMRTIPQRFDEPVDGTPVTDADRQNHGPEIAVNMFGNLFFDRGEKTLQFFGNSADGNHTASIAYKYFFPKYLSAKEAVFVESLLPSKFLQSVSLSN
jgi:hypothetical protein